MNAVGNTAMKMPLDTTPEAAGWLASLMSKFLPAAIGAALMVAVDTPKTRKAWFVRIFVAMSCSYAFYGFAFDFLHSLSWFSFLDRTNEDHQFAIRAGLGVSGWFLLGGGVQLLERWRANPSVPSLPLPPAQ